MRFRLGFKLKLLTDQSIIMSRCCTNTNFFCFFFSQLSAISITTIPIESYSFGSQYILIVPNLVLIVLCVNYIILPVFYHNNIDNCYVVSKKLVICFCNFMYKIDSLRRKRSCGLFRYIKYAYI